MSQLIFATPPYATLADSIARRLGDERGRLALQPYPDGERGLRLLTPVQGRPVVLVAGLVDDAQTTLTFDLACGLVEAGAERLTLVIPYFGCSTMEHATHPGEVVTARSRALLLSGLPRAPLGTRVGLLDPHSDTLPYFFAPDLHAQEVPVEGHQLAPPQSRPSTSSRTTSTRVKNTNSTSTIATTAIVPFQVSGQVGQVTLCISSSVSISASATRGRFRMRCST